jgi:hypothetical protein
MDWDAAYLRVVFRRTNPLVVTVMGREQVAV